VKFAHDICFTCTIERFFRSRELSSINELNNKYEYSAAPDSPKITMSVQKGDSISCFLDAQKNEMATKKPAEVFPKEKPLEGKKETTDKKSLILSRYKNSAPKQWGEKTDGVVTSLKTKEKVIALTFDACGSKGDSYDKKLIDFLIKNKIPATLFLNSRWIEKNPKTAKELAQNPLFEIENHGSQHKPLSVNGKSAYGIKGTQNASEVYDEVENNAKKIQQLSGHRPKFFRPGTAYCDDIGVKIAEDLGQKVAGYNLLGDAGATFSKAQIERQLATAKSGSIALFHMNKPSGSTAEALTESLPKLRSQGFKFVRLDQVETK